MIKKIEFFWYLALYDIPAIKENVVQEKFMIHGGK